MDDLGVLVPNIPWNMVQHQEIHLKHGNEIECSTCRCFVCSKWGFPLSLLCCGQSFQMDLLIPSVEVITLAKEFMMIFHPGGGGTANFEMLR